MVQTSSSVPRVTFPVWLEIAFLELGVREDTRPGKSNPRIEEFHAATAGGRANQSVPWCSSWMCWVMERAGFSSTKSKAAASWSTWGDSCGLLLGSVVIFGKSDPDAAGTGHVAILLGTLRDECFVIGANQRNAVSIATKKLSTVVATRWPRSV
jgi:uncharacterized protein (TIGR02594 family)